MSMKKIMAIGFICLLFIVGILISCLLYIKNIYGLFLLMVVLYGGCVLSVVGLVKYRTYMNSKIIDPKRDLKRNYEKIFLGIQNREAADENTLDLRGYSRNFFVDSLLVQRYYSFLSSDGTITVFAGTDKHYVNDKSICPLDYPLLHPVTLMENGIKPAKYYMYNPFIGMLFLWVTVFGSNREGLCPLDELTATIIDFCKVRNVNIQIIQK